MLAGAALALASVATVAAWRARRHAGSGTRAAAPLAFAVAIVVLGVVAIVAFYGWFDASFAQCA
jgi:hypothetical protein